MERYRTNSLEHIKNPLRYTWETFSLVDKCDKQRRTNQLGEKAKWMNYEMTKNLP